jgi:hypothetical protein
VSAKAATTPMMTISWSCMMMMMVMMMMVVSGIVGRVHRPEESWLID